jgi:hypothetical protein
METKVPLMELSFVVCHAIISDLPLTADGGRGIFPTFAGLGVKSQP